MIGVGDRLGQVVASEPSLGNPHPHYKLLVNNASPGAGYATVDVSAEVPVGTKMIYVNVQHTTAAAGRRVTCYTDSTPTPARGPVNAITTVASVVATGSGLVILAADRTFVYGTSGALAGLYIEMHEYWI